MSPIESSTRPTTSPRPQRPLISVVIPCHNEEGCVDELIDRLKTVLTDIPCDYELIFIDDGSTDNTLACVRTAAEADSRIKYISFSRNFGHQMALSAGIEHANGDAIVSLDGDLQHPPELIPALIEHWRSGNDVVYTVRTGNEGKVLKELFSTAYYFLMRKLTGVDIPAGGADFRLIDRRVADVVRSCHERFIFVRGLIPWLGFVRKPVPYQAARRFAGETKYVTRRMLSFALDGIFAFSTIPLRFISLLGAITIGLGILYGAYSISIRLFSERAVSGWTSLIIVTLVFSGTQLLSLGILSEYVGRIYEEVKGRPRYVISSRSATLGGGGGS